MEDRTNKESPWQLEFSANYAKDEPNGFSNLYNNTDLYPIHLETPGLQLFVKCSLKFQPCVSKEVPCKVGDPNRKQVVTSEEKQAVLPAIQRPTAPGSKDMKTLMSVTNIYDKKDVLKGVRITCELPPGVQPSSIVLKKFHFEIDDTTTPTDTASYQETIPINGLDLGNVTKQITGFSVDYTDLAFIDFDRKKLNLKVGCSMVYEKCAKLQNPCTVGNPLKSQKVVGEITIDTTKAGPAWGKEEGLSGTKFFENPWG